MDQFPSASEYMLYPSEISSRTQRPVLCLCELHQGSWLIRVIDNGEESITRIHVICEAVYGQ
jgi:hypothetical protein